MANIFELLPLVPDMAREIFISALLSPDEELGRAVWSMRAVNCYWHAVIVQDAFPRLARHFQEIYNKIVAGYNAWKPGSAFPWPDGMTLTPFDQRDPARPRYFRAWFLKWVREAYPAKIRPGYAGYYYSKIASSPGLAKNISSCLLGNVEADFAKKYWPFGTFKTQPIIFLVLRLLTLGTTGDSGFELEKLLEVTDWNTTIPFILMMMQLVKVASSNYDERFLVFNINFHKPRNSIIAMFEVENYFSFYKPFNKEWLVPISYFSEIFQ